jgi:hypothetical protein
MIEGRDPRLRLKEVVVDDVQADDAERNPRDTDLRAECSQDPGRRPRLSGWVSQAGQRSPIVRSKKPTTRRSYSSGAASIAPVCPPGAAQYSFGPFAAS